MSDDPEIRYGQDRRLSVDAGQQNPKYTGDNERRRTVQKKGEPAPTDDVVEGDGSDGVDIKDEFPDGLEIFEGVTASGAFARAVSDYDDTETEMQFAEHWEFTDEEFNRDGHF